jgi:hypothetical protein
MQMQVEQPGAGDHGHIVRFKNLARSRVEPITRANPLPREFPVRANELIKLHREIGRCSWNAIHHGFKSQSRDRYLQAEMIRIREDARRKVSCLPKEDVAPRVNSARPRTTRVDIAHMDRVRGIEIKALKPLTPIEGSIKCVIEHPPRIELVRVIRTPNACTKPNETDQSTPSTCTHRHSPLSGDDTEQFKKGFDSEYQNHALTGNPR